MTKSRNGACLDCGQYWVRIRDGNIPDYQERCPNCRKEARRRITRDRVRRWRQKRKTAHLTTGAGGSSINESDTSIATGKPRVKPRKSINRVGRGREGGATPPLAVETLPPMEMLAQHNRQLYDRVMGELRALNASFGETPEPVITGVTQGKK